MSITLVILVFLGLACLGLGVWAWRERSRAEDLNQQLREAEQAVLTRDTEIAGLRAQVSAAKDKQDYLERNFQQTQQQLRETISTVARDALKDVFGEAGKDLDARKTAVETLVKPLTEKLQSFDQNVKELEGKREKAYGDLGQQVSRMIQDQRQLKIETANLVNSLRRPEVRGAWGEMQLRRVVELAGMLPYCVSEQETSKATGLRPDMRVKLPAGREIIIDAKTPIDAYLSAIASTDQDISRQHMQNHARQIFERVEDLASKEYQGLSARSPGFVVMFIPSESFLQAALDCRPTLIEDAMHKSVVITTPSSLMALLRAVAAGWREEQIAQEAKRIGDLGRDLHKHVATALENLQRLGNNLDSTVKAFNSHVGSMQSSVLGTARKLEELGAKSLKELPEELTPVENVPRPVAASTIRNS